MLVAFSVMAKHIWSGHEIEVKCYTEPKFLWLGLGFSVCVDGVMQGQSSKRIEGIHTDVPFQFNDGEITRHGRVKSGHPFTAAWAPYRIFIEEKQIASGVTRAPNWYVTYGIMAVFVLVLLFLLRLFLHKHAVMAH
jgi:hypothetical protein